jgi:arylsulfatase
VSGPFDRWPTGDGFEKFYGFLGGDTNQYAPPIVDGVTPLDPPKSAEEGYHLSEDITDQAIAWVRAQQAMTPDKPFFIYHSFGATHAPHHVPKDWIDKYKGKFDHGWDKQREITFAAQKKLSVIPQTAELTRRPDEIPAWDSFTDDDRKVAARLMETYAAFASHTDHQVGRLIDALAEIGVLENTLVFYILGDNGASAEAGPYGTFNEMALQNQIQLKTDQILPHLDDIGSPRAFNHYNAGWAHAMDTPYQWTKAIASHWGGTRTGMIVHWPGGIKAKGDKRDQFIHVIDYAPTILEVAGIPAPEFVDGIQQKPMEGISFAYTFGDAKAPERHTTQYFEIACNRGIYHQGWTALTRHTWGWSDPREKEVPFAEDRWELYAPEDWTQAHDLAAEQPAKLRELQDLFLIEASKFNVFPLDDRKYERLNPVIAGRPDLMQGRTSIRLYPGQWRMNENTLPNVKNTSFNVIAELSVPKDGVPSGAIFAQGGSFGGWCLYCKDGVPGYCHNWVALERYYVRGREPLKPGKHRVRFEFKYDGGGPGKGGTGTLYVDDAKVGEDRIEHTVPFLFSYDDFADVARTQASPSPTNTRRRRAPSPAARSLRSPSSSSARPSTITRPSTPR